MPPFRKGPIEVDSRLDGEALHALRDVGHGRRINIVDASYDIPDGARTIKFSGSSADALSAIVQLIPLDGSSVVEYMRPDAAIEDSSESSNAINFAARTAFRATALYLDKQQGIGINLYPLYRKDKDEAAQNSGDPGFYSVANREGDQRLFVLTLDDLPFACASLVVGHSQRESIHEPAEQPEVINVSREDFKQRGTMGYNVSWGRVYRLALEDEDFPLRPVEGDLDMLSGNISAAVQYLINNKIGLPDSGWRRILQEIQREQA